jgi:hypothetical protein
MRQGGDAAAVGNTLRELRDDASIGADTSSHSKPHSFVVGGDDSAGSPLLAHRSLVENPVRFVIADTAEQARPLRDVRRTHMYTSP